MSDMVFTILGCGSSPGVPRIGNDWGTCDPENPKNRRTRCSLLVERISPTGKTTVLVDTSPDFRFQMLRENVQQLDGVLYTHPHADHLHGIDDLRGFWILQKERINTYADQATANRLNEAFEYCYKTPKDSTYPPILNQHLIEPNVPICIDGAGGEILAEAYHQHHGTIKSLGFRFGKFAYSSDVNEFDDDIYEKLQGVEILVIDALRYRPHPSHFSVDEALEAANRIGAKRIILTHMHIDLDYEILKSNLPKNAEPAYDGMKIKI